MSIHLESEYLKIILDIVAKHELTKAVYVFGSRARGDHKKYSDLDLAIKNETPLPAQTLVKMKDDFENSQLPFTVDVIEWSKITPEFKKNIENDLIPLI